MREVRTGGQRLWMDEEGIIRVEMEKDLEIRRAQAEAAVRAIAELAGDGRVPILVDYRGMRSMDGDARRYFAGPDTCAIVAAAALIVRSPLTKAIGSFFMGLNKPISPTRMFTSEPEALQWLRAFL